jgi:hypothetical protein
VVDKYAMEDVAEGRDDFLSKLIVDSIMVYTVGDWSNNRAIRAVSLSCSL